MGRGSTGLDSNEYDHFLADKASKGGAHSRGAERELRQRHLERKAANKGYEGWHFGIDDKPVKCRDKEEFKRELEKRNLMMRDDLKKPLDK